MHDFYKAENWHIPYCDEHGEPTDWPDYDKYLSDKWVALDKDSGFARIKLYNDNKQHGVTYRRVGDFWFRHLRMGERFELGKTFPVEYCEVQHSRIIHVPSYRAGSNEPTTCDCLVYETEFLNTPLWSVDADAEITYMLEAYKILDGQHGSRNKYLINRSDSSPQSWWNVISKGRFQDHGAFLDEVNALEFSNDLLYRKIGKTNERIIMNLNKLLAIRPEQPSMRL